MSERRARLLGLLRFAVAEFGPLLVFYALLAAFGLKVAIGGSILYIVADVVRRRLLGIDFDRIYKLAAGLTVAFGLIDLSVQTPFMLSYESVITSCAVGLFFVAGSRGDRPMILEAAEKRQGSPYPARPDVIFFFRLLTLLWAASFFLKAAFYLWLALSAHPVAETMAIRSVVGPATLGLMFLISFQGRRLFALLKRLGWLPAPEPAP